MPAHEYTPEKRISLFWSRINKNGSIPAHRPELGQCWEWTAGLSDGYGSFLFNGKIDRTHRISWKIAFGDIPEGMQVLHSCDNRKCCNPDHLFLGTNKDNVQDKMNKGRQAIVNGERQGHHKLTQKQVNEIRERYTSGGISQYQLAAEYGVTQAAISLIILRKNWFHQ